MKKLSLHAGTDEALSSITETYHGVFMDLYASKYPLIIILLYAVQRLLF